MGTLLTDEPDGRLSHQGLSIVQVLQALVQALLSPAPALQRLEGAMGRRDQEECREGRGIWGQDGAAEPTAQSRVMDPTLNQPGRWALGLSSPSTLQSSRAALSPGGAGAPSSPGALLQQRGLPWRPAGRQKLREGPGPRIPLLASLQPFGSWDAASIHPRHSPGGHRSRLNPWLSTHAGAAEKPKGMHAFRLSLPWC